MSVDQIDIRKLMKAQAHGAAMPDPNTDYIDGRIGQIGTEELVITEWLIANDLTVDIPEWYSYEFYSRNKTRRQSDLLSFSIISFRINPILFRL